MNGASTSETGVVTGSPVKKESRRPKYTKFTQQELPACKPLLTPGWVISIFLIVGIIFIPIGVVSLLASSKVVQIVHRYDQTCLPGNANSTKDLQLSYIQNPGTDKNCTVTLTVPKRMKSPVYVYYELDHFYQNHRRYVKSVSSAQLQGSNDPSLSDCKPEDYVNGLPITPCGLIAWSLFNDTFNFSTVGSGSVPVNKNGIAWKSDVQKKFGSTVFPKNFPNNNLTDPSGIGGAELNSSLPLDQDEDLIVWMRTAALPNFRKLWGKIEQDFQPGDTINVAILNRYNTYSFEGKKKLVLSTTSWLGGKNIFMGVAYLTIGVLCIVLALVFLLIHLRHPRPLGDPSYLSWNRKNSHGTDNLRSWFLLPMCFWHLTKIFNPIFFQPLCGTSVCSELLELIVLGGWSWVLGKLELLQAHESPTNTLHHKSSIT